VVFHKHPTANDVVVTDREGEARKSAFNGVSFFLDDVEGVDSGKTDDFSGHFPWRVFDDFAFDGFAIQKFVVISSEFLAGLADLVGEGAPECVVILAEKKKQGIDVMAVDTGHPFFDDFPSSFSSWCVWRSYGHDGKVA